jgi:hypothetical protein
MSRAAFLYATATRYGKDAAFLANVIFCQHARPTAKLAGLVALLERGAEPRTGQFAIDVLIVDGERRAWDWLEEQAPKRNGRRAAARIRAGDDPNDL